MDLRAPVNPLMATACYKDALQGWDEIVAEEHRRAALQLDALDASPGITEVVMPYIGESVAECTIVRWLTSVGDKVARSEALLEISTEKAELEMPSPATGIVTEILVNEGETIAVHGVVAVIRRG